MRLYIVPLTVLSLVWVLLGNTFIWTIYSKEIASQEERDNYLPKPPLKHIASDSDYNRSPRSSSAPFFSQVRTIAPNSSLTGNTPWFPLGRVSKEEAGQDKKQRMIYQNKQLEFVHITKTGGTAIELAAGLANVKWGLCHYSSPKEFGPGCEDRPPDLKKRRPIRPNAPLRLDHCEAWHLPPHWYQENPFLNASTFVVVRNPYSRAVSEFHCTRVGYNGRNVTDPGTMNRWLAQRLSRAPHRDHFLPQHYYVFRNGGDVVFPEKIVDHVLHYELLHVEFPALMNQYGLSRVRLPSGWHSYTNAPKGASAGRLTWRNFSNMTMQLINKWYTRDFGLLGYRMLRHPDEKVEMANLDTWDAILHPL